jgi:hypothetical protein
MSKRQDGTLHGTRQLLTGVAGHGVTVAALPAALTTLRDELTVLRKFGAETEARIAEIILNLFEAALAAEANEVLSIEEAARRAGRSRDTIERAIRSNRLPNAGRPGKPKVRAGDLHIFAPRPVAPTRAESYDIGADVRYLNEVRRRGA